jgi:glycosyltransferase involved in cell wall biosynthesis
VIDLPPNAGKGPPPEDEPVKVAFVSSSGEAGGAEGQMYSLLDRLGTSWVPIVGVLGDGPVIQDIRRRGFTAKVIPAGPRWALLRAVLPMRRTLRRSSASVVHANGLRAAIAAVLATKWTRTPVIWLKVDCSGDGWLARAVGHQCNQIVGVSHTAVQTFRGRMRKRLHVVYPGVADRTIDAAAARRMVCDRLECPLDADVIVLSGRLCPPKGQRDLIEIAPDLLARRPTIRIVLLGGESFAYTGYEALLRMRVRELALESRVAFLGHRAHEDAIRFVSGCDLLVAPSKREPQSGWREGFGLAPVEAMSVGTPVVVSKHGSFPEVMGRHAYFVPEGDRHALAAGIVEVLASPDLRQRLSREGAEWTHHRYRLDDMVDAMKQRYRAAAPGE